MNTSHIKTENSANRIETATAVKWYMHIPSVFSLDSLFINDQIHIKGFFNLRKYMIIMQKKWLDI